MTRRRLILMRHAKSAWDTHASSDHERPLNHRGRRDAPKIGRALVDRGWVPESVFSSDSTRTRETWARLCRELETDVPIRFTRDLYHAGLGAIQRVALQVPDAIETLMMLGHNPGFEDAIAWLSGAETRFTTANAALLSLPDGRSWGEACGRPREWTLEEVIRPKAL